MEVFGPSVIEVLLDEHRVLPVLDGLDELPPPAHARVLAALNDTLDAHTPLVLTCRTADYTTAVAQAGVLAGAAVIEPAPVRATDALALLRMATPPGVRQARLGALAEHLACHPQGPTAQALASPLMVALARAVYADAPADPAELTDSRRFPTAAAVEHHLLDSLVPALYARAHRQDPTARGPDPARARDYLTYLATMLDRHGIHDLAWWQLYRWTPALAQPWTRAMVWALAAAALSPLDVLSPEINLPIVLLAGVVALVCLQGAGAWMASRTTLTARPIAAAGFTAACGGLVAATAGGTFYAVRHDRGIDGFAGSVGTLAGALGFLSLMVMFGSGLPVPPRMPSRGNLSLRNWRRRLPRAAATVLSGAVLGGAALNLSALNFTPHSHEILTWRAWQYGLAFGAVLGTGQAVLQWTRHSANFHDVTTARSSMRADRFVTLANGVTSAILVTLASLILLVTYPPPGWGEVRFQLLFALPVVGPFGLTLAAVAHAWPHYTLTRTVLALQGRLPWRLQGFLAHAHRLGILRQVGAVYQFRHARLQHHLARPGSVPRPHTSPTRSDSPSLR
ncbi:hypothetical protein [Streptomyces griseocarneus]|uniref:hypothetical protein n=1 Tax=Streptomyces griseocarneus TaxID=51201 RepID=UPI00167C931F|nr:hypothetical protein [Streptomyces griseocarneus]MBZ6476482.1 hypothetical protein [Streptomyces griseocarneus]GHG78682.1 hypothetical protein GCM10018779_58700 [Streptomyces griseocarneus]